MLPVEVREKLAADLAEAERSRVPIAPFTIFGVVFNGSKGMVSLTYLIGLVAMFFTALGYREMSRAFPVAGSVYAYAGRGITDEVPEDEAYTDLDPPVPGTH